MEINPIAYFRSPFGEKFGIPRQAGLAPGLRGRVVFEPLYRSADALRGLSGFDYLWLLWGFSGNAGRQVEGLACPDLPDLSPCHEEEAPSGDLERSDRGSLRGTPLSPPRGRRGVEGESAVAWKATVRPPRLGGNERVGVFASRSPFRPNPLGLSSVRLESIDYDAKGPDGKPLGPVINVLGADLMDGTPIYDIKPYIEYADSHPGVRSGFVDTTVWEPLEVVFPAGAESKVEDLDTLRDILSLDPRPPYHDDPTKEYTMSYGRREIRFRVEGQVLIVNDILVII